MGGGPEDTGYRRAEPAPPRSSQPRGGRAVAEEAGAGLPGDSRR